MNQINNMPKRPSRINRIHQKCYECSYEQSLASAKDCPHFSCPLYTYRVGKGKDATITPMKAIRETCLLCKNNSAEFVKLCNDPDCPLYEYREGRRLNG